MNELINLLKYVGFIFSGYFIGSILFAYLVPKVFKHIDIISLSKDSNPGCANAFKYGGIFCGIIVLLLDFFKGFIVVFLARNNLDTGNLLFILVIIAPIIGHAFPIFFKFKKGGKCILVSFGVLAALTPNLILALMLAFTYIAFSVIIIVNPHALRSVVTFGVWMLEVIIFSFFTRLSLTIIVGALIIGALVITRHLKSLKESDNKEIHFVFGKN